MKLFQKSKEKENTTPFRFSLHTTYHKWLPVKLIPLSWDDWSITGRIPSNKKNHQTIGTTINNAFAFVIIISFLAIVPVSIIIGSSKSWLQLVLTIVVCTMMGFALLYAAKSVYVSLFYNYQLHRWIIKKDNIQQILFIRKEEDESEEIEEIIFNCKPEEIIAIRWVEMKRAKSQKHNFIGAPSHSIAVSTLTTTCYHLEIITDTSEKALLETAFNTPNDTKAIEFLAFFKKITGVKNILPTQKMQ